MSGIVSGSFAPVRVASAEESAWCLPSSLEMAELDAAAVTAGSSALELMERAGRGMAAEVEGMLRREHRRVLVLCGPGNNGGDGLVVARLLAENGVPVTALITASERYSAEFVSQVARCPHVVIAEPLPAALKPLAAHVRVLAADQAEALFASAALAVDALLGTGQRSVLRGPIAKLVSRLMEEKMARPSLSIVSLDLPTGLDGDTGAVADPHVQADRTVTVQLVKRGMMQFPGRAACGSIVAVNIGIAVRQPVACSAIEGPALPRLAPRRSDSHKGDLGRILVVGGSAAMPGAPVLAVLGALHAGAGLVTRVVRAGWGGLGATPECMHEVLPGDAPFLMPDDVPHVVRAATLADVVVVGPGLGQSAETVSCIRGLVQELKAIGKRVVADADALNAVAQHGISLQGLQAVITPHPGEASRLLGKPVSVIQGDRFAAAQELSERYSGTAVLKGAGTIVCGEGRMGVVARGTPYLATAGSGDVLSGIVAALLARSESSFDAAALGAYIHACAGERASSASGGPVLAGDVARAAASVIGVLER